MEDKQEEGEEEEESTQKQLDRFVWSQVQELVKSFGPYGCLLSPKIEYPAHNVVYEQGIPHRVWLRIQTSAMQSFQQWIQRRFGETKLEPDHELKVGDYLLARYALDGFLYRAKVEEVDIVEEEVVVMVRFVDYGNFGDGLTREDLAPWSPYLSRIPPQVEISTLSKLQNFSWLRVISLVNSFPLLGSSLSVEGHSRLLCPSADHGGVYSFCKCNAKCWEDAHFCSLHREKHA